MRWKDNSQNKNERNKISAKQKENIHLPEVHCHLHNSYLSARHVTLNENFASNYAHVGFSLIPSNNISWQVGYGH